MPDADNRNFLVNIIENDIESGINGGNVVTRFPPEPNGYLHLGHAKSIFLNYRLASQFKGRMNLRFDDTNPSKESNEYINAIYADTRWLLSASGSNSTDSPQVPWNGEVRYTSDYFDKIYAAALHLIRRGLAYVDDSTSG